MDWHWKNVSWRGHNITTPLFNINESIAGVFSSEEESFTPGKHQVKINITPGVRLKEIRDQIKTERVMLISPTPTPSSFHDVTTDTKNEFITPGSVGELSGSRLKIDPDDPQQGVFLIAQNGTEFRAMIYIRNKPANLIFMIPTDLAAGEYALEVRSIFQNTKSIKTGRLPIDLTVKS